MPVTFDPSTVDMSDFPSTGYAYDDPFAQSAHNNKKVTGKDLAQIQAAMLFGYRNAQRAMANTPGVQNGSLNGLPVAPFTIGLPGISEHRLTLTSGTSVTTSDVTGATALILEPHVGRGISLNDGFAWKRFEFDRQTIQLGTRTSGRPCDVFAKVSNGRFDYRLVEWSSGTARATAIVRKDGVYVMDGDYRWKYLGTFCTTSTTATEDSKKSRLLINHYNRVQRKLRAHDGANNWTSTNNAYETWNGGTTLGTARVDALFPSPSGDNLASLVFNGVVSNSGAAFSAIGIGLDSTTVNSATQISGAASTTLSGAYAAYREFASLGYHYFQMLQRPGSSGTTTFQGDGGVDYLFSALEGEVWG